MHGRLVTISLPCPQNEDLSSQSPAPQLVLLPLAGSLTNCWDWRSGILFADSGIYQKRRLETKTRGLMERSCRASFDKRLGYQ
jgi:hypothetical protein